MTREEEIKEASRKYFDDYIDGLNGEILTVQKTFEDAAKWADKTMLDRACDWLKENIDLYSYNAFNTKSGYTEITLTDVFETAFRQAMKGES